MRLGCFTGVLLMILAFGIMGFFMLPLAFEDNEEVLSLHTTVLCDPGSTFTTDFRTRSDMRGTIRGGQVYCVDVEGRQTNVTEKSFIYALIGFLVPFMIGLFITIGASNKTPEQDMLADAFNMPLQGGQTTGTVRVSQQSYQIDPQKVDINALLKQFGLDNFITTGQSKGLTEQLKDLQMAYDKRLISKEEFENLRQQIIDNASRSN